MEENIVENVLLFGASRGGRNFMKNYAGNYNYLAIIDNDEKKRGKLLDNIEIILPSQILEFSYDKIIVTSMYVNSIKKQLIELDIPLNKIEYASKNSMKMDEFPFENPQVVKKAVRLMNKITEALDDIPHFYTFGTLLGIVRDSRLIPWDDDIDVAIFSTDVKRIEQALLNYCEEFEKLFDIQLYTRIYSTGKPASITLDLLENNKKIFHVNFDCMYEDGEIIKQELNDTPKHFFEEYTNFEFEGNQLPVPKNYEAYLDYSYGDWHIVKRDTSFADNTISFREPLYSCSNEELYKTIKLAEV